MFRPTQPCISPGTINRGPACRPLRSVGNVTSTGYRKTRFTFFNHASCYLLPQEEMANDLPACCTHAPRRQILNYIKKQLTCQVSTASEVELLSVCMESCGRGSSPGDPVTVSSLLHASSLCFLTFQTVTFPPLQPAVIPSAIACHHRDLTESARKYQTIGQIPLHDINDPKRYCILTKQTIAV